MKCKVCNQIAFDLNDNTTDTCSSCLEKNNTKTKYVYEINVTRIEQATVIIEASDDQEAIDLVDSYDLDFEEIETNYEVISERKRDK